MPDLILRQRLSETSIPLNIALNGVAPAGVTETQTVEVFWRWEDEADMVPQYLIAGKPGETLAVPFDPKGREVRLYMLGRTATGIETDRDLREAEQTVFSPGPSLELATTTVIAGEDLTAFKLIDLFLDSGDLKARLASATNNQRPAEAFIVDDADEDDEVLVYFGGNIMNGLSGLTAGAPLYLSETSGGVTHTPITTGAGKVSQRVGQALSASTMIFEPEEPVELNS